MCQNNDGLNLIRSWFTELLLSISLLFIDHGVCALIAWFKYSPVDGLNSGDFLLYVLVVVALLRYGCSGEPPAGLITGAGSPATDTSGPETLPALPAQWLLPPQPVPQLQRCEFISTLGFISCTSPSQMCHHLK